MTAPLLLLALTIAGSDPDTTLRLPRNGAVEIDTHMRDVMLRVGTSDVVTVRGGSAELDGGTLTISDDAGHGHSRGRSASGASGAIEIVVPAWARVEINTVGGNVTLAGTPNRLQAETVNGFIHANGGSGTLELTSMAGAIVVADFHGTKLTISSTGGAVSVASSSGSIEIDNIDQGITLRGIRSTSVSAASINGPVEFEGTFAPAGNYEFSSLNDNVTFVLPADVSARMEITTMGGSLRSSEIPATTQGFRGAPSKDKGAKGDKSNKKRDPEQGDPEHTFTAVFGSGAARVAVDVFNGDVIVKKKP